MRAARLNKRVLIQVQLDTTKNQYGEKIEEWQDLMTVWAGIEPLSGKEFFAAQERNAELTTRIVIRYRSGLGPFIRFKYQGRTFYPSGQPIDKNSSHEELEFICHERI